MNRDNFFKQMEAKAAAIAQKKEQEIAKKQQVVANLKEALPLAERIAKEYSSKLDSLGIANEVSVTEYFFSFKVFFNDGGHHGVQLFEDKGYMKLQSTFTNDDGKNFTATDGSHFTSIPWSEKAFEDFLQKEIDSFFFYADRHGGTKKKN